MLEECEDYLAEFQPLSEACEAQASQFLGEAPSTLTVGGLLVHPEANGEYSIAPQTVGGKAHWIKHGSDGRPVYHLYFINVPHDSFVLGVDLRSYDALVETYEGHPPWGNHTGWNELQDSAGTVRPVRVSLKPGYSDHDCQESLRLRGPDLTERCLDGKRHADGSFTTRQTFEQLLAAGTG
eukprot:SAG22_NODE_1476_length_4329_cov_2.702128_2_plen_181_part_00